MIKLFEVSGSKDPEEIVTKMHRDEEEGEILRARQESVESSGMEPVKPVGIYSNIYNIYILLQAIQPISLGTKDK